MSLVSGWEVLSAYGLGSCLIKSSYFWVCFGGTGSVSSIWDLVAWLYVFYFFVVLVGCACRIDLFVLVGVVFGDVFFLVRVAICGDSVDLFGNFDPGLIE